MIRARAALLAAATAAALTLSSCAVTANPAASVGDETLSVRDFETHLEELSNAQPDSLLNSNGTISGATARSLLGLWVTSRILADDLATQGETVTDADREQAAATVEQDGTYTDVAAATLDWIVEMQATQVAFSRANGLPSDEAQALYEQGPDRSGLFCIRGFITTDQAAAQAALDRVRAGEPFADVATEVSPESPNGGVVTDPTTGSECFGPETAQTLNATLAQALASTAVGDATDVVDLGGGSFAVVQLRPYDEVADAVDTALASSGAVERQGTALAEADSVSVNSKYGRWDAQRATVVPLS